MMVCLLAIIPLLTASAQASRLHAFLARQSAPIDPSEFPPPCQSLCTPIINVINGCTSASCLCSNTNGQSLQSCLDCAVAIVGSSVQGQAQTVIDGGWSSPTSSAYLDFNNECAIASATFTPLSLSPTTTGASAAVPTTTPTAPPFSFTTSSTMTSSSMTTTPVNPAATFSSSTLAATTTGSGAGGSSNPFPGAALGGKRLGTWGLMGVFGTGLASAVVLLM